MRIEACMESSRAAATHKEEKAERKLSVSAKLFSALTPPASSPHRKSVSSEKRQKCNLCNRNSSPHIISPPICAMLPWCGRRWAKYNYRNCFSAVFFFFSPSMFAEHFIMCYCLVLPSSTSDGDKPREFPN